MTHSAAPHGWVSLAQPLSNEIPKVRPDWPVSFDAVEIPHVDGIVGRITMAEFPVHTGTHIDSPVHLFPGAKGIDEYPVDFFLGSGVVLGISAGPAQVITADDLRAASPEIREGDIVFLSLGFAQAFNTSEYHDHPYLSEDAATFLVERGVRIVGMDVLTPDMPVGRRPADFGFPVHSILLSNDVLIIENAGGALRQLEGRRVEFVMAPLPIVGADGAPIVPLARVIS
jgi:arylformamidase